MNHHPNPCICALHLPEVGKKLNEMRQEIMGIVQSQPNRRRYILHVITKEIKQEIVEKRLQHGRCFCSLHCYNEMPAMSRHFVCPAEHHTNLAGWSFLEHKG